MNFQQALDQAEKVLSSSSPSAALDAQVLLTHVLDCNTAHLAAWPEKELDDQQQSAFERLVLKRQQGLPVAHLTGTREFWSLDLMVNNSTLIPRPETETLIEFILKRFSDNRKLNILDMGTGTGAIAIALATEKPDWSITACDISLNALSLAGQNVDLHQLDNVSLIQSNWFDKITDNNFDIIVSNPPYIAEHDPHLEQGDVRFEPESALTSGHDGLRDIKHLCQHANDYLSRGGILIVEHGYNQQQQVAECFTRNGFSDIEQLEDMSGHTRMTKGVTGLKMR